MQANPPALSHVHHCGFPHTAQHEATADPHTRVKGQPKQLEHNSLFPSPGTGLFSFSASPSAFISFPPNPQPCFSTTNNSTDWTVNLCESRGWTSSSLGLMWLSAECASRGSGFGIYLLFSKLPNHKIPPQMTR